jgi:4'-phosphopantetheinyl transferase
VNERGGLAPPARLDDVPALASDGFGLRPLEPAHADVWFVYPDAIGAAQGAELFALLSVEERRRAAAIHFERDRHCFVVTRALLRSSLSRYAAVAPHVWRFGVGATGKPFIDEPSWARVIEFNVAHTRGFGACVVADRSVGIDVENTTRPLCPPVLERCLDAIERCDVLAQPREELPDRFFRYWTLKESYVKARGLGLRVPFGSLHCRLEGSVVRIEHEPGGADGGRAWRFETWRATEEHRVSIAVRRTPAPLVLRVRWGVGRDATSAPDFVPRGWVAV